MPDIQLGQNRDNSYQLQQTKQHTPDSARQVLTIRTFPIIYRMLNSNYQLLTDEKKLSRYCDRITRCLIVLAIV